MNSNKIYVKFVTTGLDVKVPVTENDKVCQLIEKFFSLCGKELSAEEKSRIFFELGTTHKKLEPTSQSTVNELNLKKNGLIIVKDTEGLIVKKAARGEERFGTKILEDEVKDAPEKFPEILGDMAVFSEVCLGESIQEETEYEGTFKNYKEALASKDKHDFLFGLIGKYLEEVLEMSVFIDLDKNATYTGADKAKGLKILRYLSNGYITKTKATVNFTPISTQSLCDEKQKKDITKNFKKNLVQKYTKLNDDNFVVRNIPDGLMYKFCLITAKENDLDLEENVLQKFKDYSGSFNKKEDPEYEEGKPIMESFVLNGSFLMKQYDSNDDSKFGYNERRGGEPYYPPVGWWRYGVLAYSSYGNDNTWLGYDFNKSWCVAYIGLRKLDIEEKVKEFENDNDLRHNGKKVGLGVAVCPKPEDMEADCEEIEHNGWKYKIGFMLRINPKAIRIPESGNGKYWIVSGTKDDLRPYSILSKRYK